MRTTILVFATAVLVAIAFIALTFHQSAAAQQPEQKSWSHVQVVTYASGLTGFFDTKSGKLYLYDGNLDQPIVIRELDELGKPLKRIKN